MEEPLSWPNQVCLVTGVHFCPGAATGRSGVTANADHPGIVRTRLMREAPTPMRLRLGFFSFMAPPPQKAAAGLVWLAATRGNGVSGQLLHGQKPLTTRAYTRDEAAQERLWAASARLARASEESFG